MSNYDKKFIKEAEQGCYYVNDPKDADKPKNWRSIKKYENQKTGFKAEAFINENGQKVFAISGTDLKTKEDCSNDIQLLFKKIPQQANDAYLAFEDFNNRYGDGEIIVLGYSLGGSLAQIICNETGARGITF